MKLYKKMKFILMLSIIIISVLFIQCNVQAANFSVSSSKSSVTVGDTFTVTINGTGLTGKYNIKGNANVTISGDTSPWIENTTHTITCTAKTEGTATITVTPETVADSATGEDLNLAAKTVSVTIKAKETPTTTNQGGSNSTTPTATEPKFTDANRTMYATGDINLRASWSTSSSATSVEKGTELKVTGTSTNQVNGYVWYRVSYNGATKYVASNLLSSTKPTVQEEPTKSNNANLKSLIIENQEITPKFNTETTKYTMQVGEDVIELSIKAEAEDAKATVTIRGEKELKEGKNTVTISVSAEDGTVKIYEIEVTKEALEVKELALQSLRIKGTNISAMFEEGVYEYKIDVQDVEKLEIEAIANDEEATVEILGNEELQEGENLITIIVSSKEGDKKVTYQIRATKTVGAILEDESQEVDYKMYVYIGVGALILIILIIVIIYFIKRRNKDEYDDDYEEEYSNDYNEFTRKEEDNSNIEIEENASIVNNQIVSDTIDDIKSEERNTKLDFLFDIEDGTPKRGRGKHF